MKVGIAGFAGAGKTTIFSALTGLKGESHSSGPHLGVIKVPDRRLRILAQKLQLKKLKPAEITFIDFAPGKGDKALDPAIINQMREADALAQVVRDFVHPFTQSPPDPAGEIRDFDAELKLADLALIENRLHRLKKEQASDREADLLRRCQQFLEGEKPLRALSLTDEERKTLAGFGFLTEKPLLVLLNRSEKEFAQPLSKVILEELSRTGTEVIPLCGEVERELTDLEEKDQLELLKELGLEEPAKDRFIRSCYNLMDLISFLTHNEEEVRAWTIKRGTTAVKAAGKIHSDMERGFIRAEVVHSDDLAKYGTEAKCREAGKWRLEGKDYQVQDGDMIRFRFHV